MWCSAMSLKDVITRWLVEEAFIVSKLEVPPEVRVSWGINVSTPGTPGVRFTVLSPVERPDKVILAMVIAISPEHRNELDKMKPAERVRAMHSILSKALSVCIDCKIAVQPNILSPQGITINAEIYEEELTRYSKPYFMRLIARFLNTYLAIVSGFNEWFPIIPPGAREKEESTFM